MGPVDRYRHPAAVRAIDSRVLKVKSRRSLRINLLLSPIFVQCVRTSNPGCLIGFSSHLRCSIFRRFCGSCPQA